MQHERAGSVPRMCRTLASYPLKHTPGDMESEVIGRIVAVMAAGRGEHAVKTSDVVERRLGDAGVEDGL